MMKTDLTNLCALLYGANYQVSLREYVVECSLTISVTDLLQDTFGTLAEIVDCHPITEEEIREQIKECIDYVGDESSGPLKEKISSKEFLALRTSLLEEVSKWAAASIEIYSFCFKRGHPDYPVFWDFAFVFRNPESSRILVGASSD